MIENRIRVKIQLLLFISVISLTSCSLNGTKNIEITKEYILNENWNENINICIQRMKIQDGRVLDIFALKFDLSEVNHWNIVNKLEADSSYVFNYYEQSNNTFSNRKVYFNQATNGQWRTGCYSVDSPKDTIGNLENDTWYKVSKLIPGTQFHIFIFIDQTGNVHRFDQDLSNI